jgi:asparagine synthetase B (glutamine-hydrolysing)
VVLNFTMIGRPDPCFAWDGTSVRQALPTHLPDGSQHDGAILEGAFAAIVGSDDDDGGVRLARDPLGLDKLFWAAAGDRIELASRPSLLTDRGHPLEACYAVPANSLVSYPESADPGSPVVTPIAAPALDAEGPTAEPLERIARRIHATTARYVAAILAARPGPVVVCLSGGLDSTSIAALVREHRDDVIAVTFDLERPGRAHRSDDSHAAVQAARHLGLTVTPAVHPPASILEWLDDVLAAGIDWRDFNVHAGLVNAGLALTIAEIVGSRRHETTVFTGDLVNELVADYHEETYRAKTYYRLPRLPMAATRAALVRGLATSHREIGVFAHYGLSVVQPYAAARSDFLRLPTDILGPGQGKSTLYRLMFGDTLPRSCYDRPKTRAQTGSEQGDRGVLAACVDAGIDAPSLAQRFAQLHHAPDTGALTRFMRAGRYRTAIPRGDHDPDH